MLAIRTQVLCTGHLLLFITGIPRVSPDTSGPLDYNSHRPKGCPDTPTSSRESLLQIPLC